MKIPRKLANPELDVIEKHPNEATQRPILFVHGANMSAWCWNEHFMSFFTELGHPTYAVSLRSHGNSDGHETVSTNSIADYVNDVKRVINKIGEEPILVGHSLGGLIIQKYIEKKTVPACILLAPVPEKGLLPSLMDLALYNPAFYTQLNLLQLFGTPFTPIDLTRKSIFSGKVSDEIVIRYCAHMQPESPRALLDSLWLGLPSKQNPFDIPMLILGADEDAFFRPDHIEETAEAFKADYENMMDTSHAMMLDSHWKQSATTMENWLVKNKITSTTSTTS